MVRGTIHIDKALTQVSVSYQQQAFIAEDVFPELPVDFQSDKYYTYGKDRFRARIDIRAPGTEAQQSNWTLGNDSYYCDGHALKDMVPRESQKNQDPALDLMVDTTEVLTQQVGLNQEIATVAEINANVTNQIDAKTTPWNSGDVDPIQVLLDQCDVIGGRVGQRPNSLALGARDWTAIQNNPNVKGRISGAGNLEASKVTVAAVAALLEIERILIGRSVKLTSAEGQTDVLSYVWDGIGLLFYRPPSPGRKTLSLGYTMKWKNAVGSMDAAIAGVPGNGSQFVQQYFWQPTISDVIEVHKYYAAKTVAADAGTLFKNVRG